MNDPSSVFLIWAGFAILGLVGLIAFYWLHK